jgi:hypothetical protein
MPTKPKVHYQPPANYHVGYLLHLYCGPLMLSPKTTGDVNKVTCPRCKGLLAVEMFNGTKKREKHKNGTL